MTERWKIIDSETGKRVTIVTFFTEQQALDQIEAWKRRQEKGGRPDITREMLDRQIPAPEDGDYS